MIISASYRTDIPSFYSRWFSERLKDGYCTVDNPYNRKIYTVKLDPDSVDAFVFWTRRVTPFLKVLENLRSNNVPFVVQFTVTGYPHSIEPSIANWSKALDEIRLLSQRFGQRSVVWRYDPIIISNVTPEDYHIKQMHFLASKLTGYVDEVIMSFVQPYQKTIRNLRRRSSTYSLFWTDPEDCQKKTLLSQLASVTNKYRIRATICSQPNLLSSGLKPAQCIDLKRISDLAQKTITAKSKANRPGCECSESRDIGVYNTCPNGCVYCYAVNNHDFTKRRFKNHNPSGKKI